MDRRMRIFMYGVILGLIVFFFIFQLTAGVFKATQGG